MFKPLLTILAGLLCSFTVFAQGVELQDDHPQTYTVVRGDTLWDISERFLKSPWLWPEIWQANPQIDNPHLIYPGDVIRLVYVDGRPQLQLERGERPVVKLSPRARATPLREAIKPIRLSEIRQYLDKRTLIDAEEMDTLPYVVALDEQRRAATTGTRVYVRDLEAEPGQTYAFVRPTAHFIEVPQSAYPWRQEDELEPRSEPWTYPGGKSISDHVENFWREVVMASYTDDIRDLGYEVVQTGIGEVMTGGDPSTLLITESDREVMEGDLVIPVFTSDYDLEYMPHSPSEVPDNMRVIAISKSLFGAGPNEVVAINRGAADGVDSGQTYAVFYEGEVIRDRVKYPKDDVKTYFSRSRRQDAKVKLPDEYAAHVMIFKTHENVSYGLIMRANRPVKVNNLLKAP